MSQPHERQPGLGVEVTTVSLGTRLVRVMADAAIRLGWDENLDDPDKYLVNWPYQWSPPLQAEGLRVRINAMSGTCTVWFLGDMTPVQYIQLDSGVSMEDLA